jgi:hypothetical protein
MQKKEDKSKIQHHQQVIIKKIVMVEAIQIIIKEIIQ